MAEECSASSKVGTSIHGLCEFLVWVLDFSRIPYDTAKRTIHVAVVWSVTVTLLLAENIGLTSGYFPPAFQGSGA